jgi:hypothetical protein
MNTRRFVVVLLLTVFFSGVPQAFELIGSKWATPSVAVEMDFFAINGGASPSGVGWSQAYAEAANSWNVTTPFRFNLSDRSIDPCAGFAAGTGDNRNGTGFGDSLCGRPFGFGVLAVTITYALVGSPETVETDTIFNAGVNWDVYTGPWLGNVSDFRRVAAHEQGHMLGLDHEDDVPALMATFVSVGNTIERPQTDDINGVNFLYGNSNSREPIVLNLEEPVNGEVKTGIANIRGWAVSLNALSRIELFIDGVARSNIPVGGRRADVADDFPDYPNSADAGFSLAFNYNALAEGNHTILVRAFDNVGNARDFSSNFNVVRFDNPFIQNASSVDLSNATITKDQSTIVITNLRADGRNYDVTLRWQAATQSYEIVDIR